MKELIFIYLFLISNFLTFSQCSTSSEVADIVNALSNAENSYLNKEVPNLHFRTSKGENFDLLSLRGQVVTINYWAFTCRPCIAEMPELNKVVRKYQESVKFISIITPGDFEIESQIIQKKLDKFDFDYQHLATKECFSAFLGLPNIYPTHIVIDKEGKLVEVFYGADITRLKKAIKNNI